MRKILILILIAIFAFLCNSCEYLTICEAKRYQVILKTDLGNGQCFYKLQADGDCLAWADRRHLEFKDVCTAYGLSQIVWRDSIKQKYGI